MDQSTSMRQSTSSISSRPDFKKNETASGTERASLRVSQSGIASAALGVRQTNFVARQSCKVEDKYDFVKELGRGAQGVANLVKDREGRQYVCKESLGKSSEDIDMFEEEFNSMRESCQHPNIAKLFEVFDFADDKQVRHLCMIVEYAPGLDLCKYMGKLISWHNEVTEQWVAGVFQQALTGVAFLHAKGILHNDLKPDNILCMSAPQRAKPNEIPTVKITDFGCTQMSADGRFISGDPRYFSPELWRESLKSSGHCKMGPEVDMWAMGVTLFELLSGGALPFLYQPCTLKVFFKAWDDGMMRDIGKLIKAVGRSAGPSCVDGVLGFLKELACGKPPVGAKWATKSLCKADESEMFREQVPLMDTTRFTSVSDTMEFLDTSDGQKEFPGDFYAVLSASKQEYYLLYRQKVEDSINVLFGPFATNMILRLVLSIVVFDDPVETYKNCRGVSSDAHDLLIRLLCKNKGDRLSADQALKHSWCQIKGKPLSHVILKMSVLNSARSAPYQVLLTALVAQLHSKEKDKAVPIFNELDSDHNGHICKDELVEGLKKLGKIKGTDTSLADRIMERGDIDGDGQLTFDEFVATTVDCMDLGDLDVALDGLLSLVDNSGNGQIEEAELYRFFQGGIDKENVREIFEQIDTDGDGTITQEELKKFIQSPMLDAGTRPSRLSATSVEA